MVAFTKLFEPGKIGKLELKNRIVMAPMGNHWAVDGYVVQTQIDYYTERARGGTALIITEPCCVQFPQARIYPKQTFIHEDSYLPGLARIARAIKENDAKAAVQLNHGGGATTTMLTGGLTPVAPSSVIRNGYEPTRALTKAEIKEIRGCFINAAVRAHKAGFDAVELHAAHQYLLAQFHSPAWNERRDEYGGSVRNRARLTMEIVSGIKNKLPDMPVICRINGQEYGTQEFFGTQGLTLEDTQEIARLLTCSGADGLHISAFGWGVERVRNSPTLLGELLPLAEAIKKAVSVPVIAVGRLLPEVAEEALRARKADFIAMGRGLLADPYLPQKVRTGELADITPCIVCLQCLGEPRRNICTVNPRNGEEAKYTYPMTKATMPKKVVVIGGGPGGMEAARVAALRGHRVTLYEQEKEMGGKLLVADKVSSKKNMSLLNPFLQRQVMNAGIQVELGKKATVGIVLDQCPDAVIIATGAKSVLPEIKGLEKAKAVDAVDFLAGKAPVGKRVIIIGGEMVGCEVAEALSERGWKDVTIVRRGLELMTKNNVPRLRYWLLYNLEKRGVKFELGVTYKEASNQGLTIIDRNGKERFLKADTIIIAAGAKPDTSLLDGLKGKVSQIITVGDAVEPRLILNAIHEGFAAAYTL